MNPFSVEKLIPAMAQLSTKEIKKNFTFWDAFEFGARSAFWRCREAMRPERSRTVNLVLEVFGEIDS
jgi:hypothetical protein